MPCPANPVSNLPFLLAGTDSSYGTNYLVAWYNRTAQYGVSAHRKVRRWGSGKEEQEGTVEHSAG